MLTTRTLAAALVLIAALACSTNSAQAGFPSNGNHNFKFQGNFNHHNFNNFNNFNHHNFNTFHNFNGNHGFNTQFHRPFVVTKPVFVPVFVPVKHHNW